MRISEVVNALLDLQAIEGDIDVFLVNRRNNEVFDVEKVGFPSLQNRYVQISMERVVPGSLRYREFCDIANGPPLMKTGS